MSYPPPYTALMKLELSAFVSVSQTVRQSLGHANRHDNGHANVLDLQRTATLDTLKKGGRGRAQGCQTESTNRLRDSIVGAA
jgi:hypothetical protein